MADVAGVTAIVVAGGEPIAPETLPTLPEGALVIAADSGLDQANALGLRVDVLIGDLDSVSAEALDAAERAPDVEVDRHPAEKDAIDLELALDSAVARGATSIVVIGGHGGRLDHLLANALLLASPRYSEVSLVAHMGSATVTVVRASAILRGAPGSTLTLLPVGGAAMGVTTQRLRYPLDDEDLPAGTTRGVSNELLEGTAGVTLRAGVVLAIQPGQ